MMNRPVIKMTTSPFDQSSITSTTKGSLTKRSIDIWNRTQVYCSAGVPLVEFRWNPNGTHVREAEHGGRMLHLPPVPNSTDMNKRLTLSNINRSAVHYGATRTRDKEMCSRMWHCRCVAQYDNKIEFSEMHWRISLRSKCRINFLVFGTVRMRRRHDPDFGSALDSGPRSNFSFDLDSDFNRIFPEEHTL
ncbi:hypothetical protein EVAR_70138_1 [Eumeta japonica]|uniref:Uncharacterized protein n=1 Tax=Eumeta variegata TaxID=151549 RepID=A0A4C1Z8Z7_EUMVA|nr:hypothetical protein EVAR_70138_1 [Eumeta japonica]